MPAHLWLATRLSRLLAASDSADTRGPHAPYSCLHPTRASSRLSTRGNIAVGAYPLFSSIQCNLPLNFVSHFWGAVQAFPSLAYPRRKNQRWHYANSLAGPCALATGRRSNLTLRSSSSPASSTSWTPAESPKTATSAPTLGWAMRPAMLGS